MTQTNTTSDIRVMAPIDGQYEAGLYTGYSHISGSHHVSFFNGKTGRYASLVSILFDETEDGAPPYRAYVLCID